MSSSSIKPFLRSSLVLLLFLSSFATSYSQLTTGCDFDSIYIFGEGRSSVSNGSVMRPPHVTSAFSLASFPFPDVKFDFRASFAIPGATVMNTSFFIRNRIQPPLVKGLLESQVDNFMYFLGSRLTMSFKDRAKTLQGSIFFINQPGFNDYKQAFSQGTSLIQISKFVPEVVSMIKYQIRKLIFNGASNVLVSGVPWLVSLREFRTLLHNLKELRMLALLHNNHLQQAIAELKLEFPEIHIVYAKYYKMNERGSSQSTIEFTKARRCNYLQIGSWSNLKPTKVLLA